MPAQLWKVVLTNDFDGCNRLQKIKHIDFVIFRQQREKNVESCPGCATSRMVSSATNLNALTDSFTSFSPMPKCGKLKMTSGSCGVGSARPGLLILRNTGLWHAPKSNILENDFLGINWDRNKHPGAVNVRCNADQTCFQD